jgi:hypothetical protein
MMLSGSALATDSISYTLSPDQLNFINVAVKGETYRMIVKSQYSGNVIYDVMGPVDQRHPSGKYPEIVRTINSYMNGFVGGCNTKPSFWSFLKSECNEGMIVSKLTVLPESAFRANSKSQEVYLLLSGYKKDHYMKANEKESLGIPFEKLVTRARSGSKMEPWGNFANRNGGWWEKWPYFQPIQESYLNDRKPNYTNENDLSPAKLLSTLNQAPQIPAQSSISETQVTERSLASVAPRLTVVRAASGN